MNVFKIPVASVLLLLTGSMTQTAISAEAASVKLSALSNRPDKLSGGDALIAVDLPENVAAADVAIKLNGDDITANFHSGDPNHALIGLVSGLRLGKNLLVALRAGETSPAAELTIKNHPISGPIFSGPQEQPFLCETEK